MGWEATKMELKGFVGWTGGLKGGRPVFGYQFAVLVGVRVRRWWKEWRVPLGPVVYPVDWARFEELPRWRHGGSGAVR